MKNKFKIFASIPLLFIALIIILPYLFEDKIIELVKNSVNDNIDATFDFENANLSLWSSFPHAKISLEEISLINNTPFQGDTLFTAKKISLKFPFKEIFNLSSNTIKITNFTLDSAYINIKIDSTGNANYDISKEENNKSESTTKEHSTFKMGLESYEIKNCRIIYTDDSSKMSFKLTDFNHFGSGNFSSENLELTTTTNTFVSFAMDNVTYLNNNSLKLDAILEMDLKENIYKFLDNKLLINQLPLIFDGYVKLNDNNQEVNMSFRTPSSDFKNFLALLPEVYSKDIKNVITTGNFDINGNIEGLVDENHIPKFQIVINATDASFKYPDLSESLRNIYLKTEIANKTGFIKDTYVIIDRLSFKLNEDTFSANAKLLEVTENMKVNANLKGIINLGNLEKVYPAESVKNLKGILHMDVSTHFDMHSIDNEQYENTKTLGNLKLTDFEYSSNELSSPLKIIKTDITFNPKTVVLNNFDAQLGKTDISTSGKINNLLGFVFNDENIEGKFKITSNVFSVDDFMVSEEQEENSVKENDNTNTKIKIPSFLDCTIDVKANTVLYDNIILKNVSGTLIIKDQAVALKNMKSSVFDGILGFDGMVSTKEEIPTFQMDLDIHNFNIGQSFKTLDLLNAVAPIADVVKGKLNSKISLSGNLNDNFTPDLNSLTGNLLGQLLSTTLSSENSSLLQSLGKNISFLDLKKINLNDLKGSFSFENGRVHFKPITFKFEDIEIVVSGNHGFDTSLSYDAVVNVPSKYLGKEVTQLLSQLNDDKLNKMIVPVGVLISGKFSKPIIETDMKSAISNFSKQIVDSQKNKLIDEGKKQITSLLNDFLSEDKDTTSTKKSTDNKALEKTANDILGSLFGKKKDTTN